MRTLLAESRPPQGVEENIFSRRKVGFLPPGWVRQSRLKALTKGGIDEIAALADVERNFSDGPVLALMDNLLEVGAVGTVMATPRALRAEEAFAAPGRGLAIPDPLAGQPERM